MDATCIHCDNQSCVNLLENPMFHDKSKHIEIKYHYIWDMVQRGIVKLQYVATDDQIVDVLMKPLARVKFEYFRRSLVFSRSRSLPRGSEKSESHSDEQVRCKG